jgi:DNA replication licensing factor MCM4
MNNDMDMGDPTTPRAHIPTLSAAEPSNDDGNQDDNGLVRYIWGTNIHIQESMNDFREFLRGFKPKYRAKYNSEQAKITIEEGGVAPPSMPLYDNLSTARGDVVLYEQYLKQLRETGESVLNVDAINLVAYPPTKRLYHQLINYPQEMVPIMDQVLKDVMTEMADEELEVVRNRRAEGQISEMELRMMEEEVRDVEGRVYKTRPFGGEITINMRDLNPGGKLLARFEDAELMDRYRQARLRQGTCNSCHSCHSRHVYG